jgi:hypothetical protein
MTKVIKPNKKRAKVKKKKSEDKNYAQEGGDVFYFVGQTKAKFLYR